MKKKNMTIIGCISLLLCVVAPSFSSAYSRVTYADDYSWASGAIISGNLYSLKYSDGNSIVLKNSNAAWWDHYAILYVDFPSHDGHIISFKWSSNDPDAYIILDAVASEGLGLIRNQGVITKYMVSSNKFFRFTVKDLDHDKTVTFDSVNVFDDSG